MTKNPMSEQHEHYAQQCMDQIWDVVAQSTNLSAHEIIGILHVVADKISFDHNVRAANEEVKRHRLAAQADAGSSQQTSSQQGPSPIIDKHGFPVE
jgi:hypothetical protein